MNPATTPDYPFCPVDLARLARYRAAVQAGLYTDHVPEADPTAATVLASTRPAPEDGRLSLLAAGLTPAQVARLEAYRGAVALGIYTDFPRPASAACVTPAR